MALEQAEKVCVDLEEGEGGSLIAGVIPSQEPVEKSETTVCVFAE